MLERGGSYQSREATHHCLPHPPRLLFSFPFFLCLSLFLCHSIGLLPLPPPPLRVALPLIYYSRSSCFINCLSLRIKPAAGTWVGGRDKTRCVNQLPPLLPPRLFSLFLHPIRNASRPLSRRLPLLFSIRRVSPFAAAVHATRYNRARPVSSRCRADVRR